MENQFDLGFHLLFFTLNLLILGVPRHHLHLFLLLQLFLRKNIAELPSSDLLTLSWIFRGNIEIFQFIFLIFFLLLNISHFLVSSRLLIHKIGGYLPFIWIHKMGMGLQFGRQFILIFGVRSLIYLVVFGKKGFQGFEKIETEAEIFFGKCSWSIQEVSASVFEIFKYVFNRFDLILRGLEVTLVRVVWSFRKM